MNVCAFKDAENLTELALTEYMTSIPRSAFQNCISLTSLTIPKNIADIGASAFRSCVSLAGELKLGAKLQNVSQYAFDGCSALTSLTVENPKCSFGTGCFSNCASLASIPNNLSRYALRMFENCTSLTAIELTDSVSSLAGYVFNGCSSVAHITLANPDMTFSEGFDFSSCPLITTAGPIGGGYDLEFAFTEKIPTRAFRCGEGSGESSLVSITLPGTIKEIGDQSFGGLTSLNSIELPESLDSIGDNAFRVCSSLTSISIPLSVTKIDIGAFFACTGLRDVYIYTPSVLSEYKVNDTSKMWFQGTGSYTTLHIPESLSDDDGTKAAIAYGQYWNYRTDTWTLTFYCDL